MNLRQRLQQLAGHEVVVIVESPIPGEDYLEGTLAEVGDDYAVILEGQQRSGYTSEQASAPTKDALVLFTALNRILHYPSICPACAHPKGC